MTAETWPCGCGQNNLGTLGRCIQCGSPRPAPPAPGALACARHPGSPVKSTCVRCGDFLCEVCFQNLLQPGLCATCRERPATPRSSGLHVAARFAATGFFALAGLQLTGWSALVATVSKGTPNPMLAWNGVIGIVYFAIAIGVLRRTAKGYNWAVGTATLNLVLNGFYLVSNLSEEKHPIAIAYTACFLAWNLFGLIAVKIAKPEFRLAPVFVPRRPVGPRPVARRIAPPPVPSVSPPPAATAPPATSQPVPATAQPATPATGEPATAPSAAALPPSAPAASSPAATPPPPEPPVEPTTPPA